VSRDYFDAKNAAFERQPRERVCLQDGLKLGLNWLPRKGFVKPGVNIGLRGIIWTHPHWVKSPPA
jgi:hypothetical protein